MAHRFNMERHLSAGLAADQDEMNMVETPEDSPERMSEANSRERGGKFNHMAQNFEAVHRSVRNLDL